MHVGTTFSYFMLRRAYFVDTSWFYLSLLTGILYSLL